MLFLYLFLLTVKTIVTAIASGFRLRLSLYKTTETKTHMIFFFAYLSALAAELLSFFGTDVVGNFLASTHQWNSVRVQFFWAISFLIFLFGTLRIYKVHRELKSKLEI